MAWFEGTIGISVFFWGDLYLNEALRYYLETRAEI